MKKTMKMAVRVTFKRPGTMTVKGRRQIATWLRRVATDFQKIGGDYGDTNDFQATYWY